MKSFNPLYTFFIFFIIGFIPIISEAKVYTQQELINIINTSAGQEYDRYKSLGSYEATFTRSMSRESFISYVLATAEYEHRITDSSGKITGFNLDQNTKSTNTDGTIDYGLMQINSSVGDKYYASLDYKNNPNDNARAGASRLADLFNQGMVDKKLSGSSAINYGVSGYNPGENSTNRISGVTGFLPEPEEWAMMLLGFGMVGYQIKRKQRKVVSASE